MKVLRLGVFIVLIVFLASILSAQVGQTGAIRGQVVNIQKAPLPGVTITASSPKLMGTQSVVTAANGMFKFPPILPPGQMIVTGISGVRSYRLSARFNF